MMANDQGDETFSDIIVKNDSDDRSHCEDER